ncbi:demethoxyubiquinone hydroxylase family protein [Rickettsia endosymbiont of Halotydeus destructor]|uniref:demethoxyubiquinone hydroxylase family protein n=1 Tax=Rickettsia endosymbiont of Halotydeus destructor TaxID=2996754 RepID=UPI003BB0961B
MPRPDFSDTYTELYSNDLSIQEIIRVNHAGEYGAKRIYQGQLKYIKSSNDHALIKEMLAQEEIHLNYFSDELLKRQIRPTILILFWHHFGYLLGAGSAILGPKTAMLITQAVEEVIEEHYQKQIDYLKGIDTELLDNIIQFQADEIAHKNTAIIHDSEQAFLAPIISKIVKLICYISISLSKKV